MHPPQPVHERPRTGLSAHGFVASSPFAQSGLAQGTREGGARRTHAWRAATSLDERRRECSRSLHSDADRSAANRPQSVSRRDWQRQAPRRVSRRNRNCGHQRLSLPTVIDKQGRSHATFRSQESIERDATEQSPIGDALHGGSRFQNVLQPILTGLHGDDQHAKAAVGESILHPVINLRFALPGPGRYRRAKRFRAAVDLQEESQRGVVVPEQQKSRVRVDRFLVGGEPQRVLAMKLGDFHTGMMGGHGRMHEKVSQAPGVRVPRDSDFRKTPLRRRDCAGAMHDSVAGAGQEVVVLRLARKQGRVAKRLHQSGFGQLLQAFPDRPQMPKRLRPGDTELEQLPGRQGRPVDCGQQFLIAGGQQHRRGSCHRHGCDGSVFPLLLPSNPCCMPERKSSYIDVQALLPQVSLEQAAAFYGITLPELKRIGQEIRTRCFLNCGKTEGTSDRALAIQAESATKIWKCFQYGCTKGGNLVGLCDLMKSGESMGGRPRSERFKEIARDLQAMVDCRDTPAATVLETVAETNSTARPKSNIPLAESDNQRARELVQLDQQFVNDPAEMPPEAASYFRQRPFLTPETCQKFCLGYLPRSGKSLLRGKVVYPYFSQDGKLLTWFGRDPLFEEKQRRWLASDRTAPEPVKTQFVKGFQRGLELWGEHWLRGAESLTIQPRVGLVVVEGPNDAINLQTLGIPAVALCSNTITQEQVERIVALAHDVAGELATLMLDCDEEGMNGAAQALPLLAEQLHVRLPWRPNSHGGKYKNRQPESLSAAEWQAIGGTVSSRK